MGARVRGNVLAPMQRASTLFSEHLPAPGVPASDPRYRRALFHLLACETSCYRYRGQRTLTGYRPSSPAAPTRPPAPQPDPT